MKKMMLFLSATTATLLTSSVAQADVFGAVAANFSLFQVGMSSMFAISPSGEIGLKTESGLTISVRDTIMLLPDFSGNQNHFGVNNKDVFQIGYNGKTIYINAGFTFSQYTMIVCGQNLCGRVAGISPGADVAMDYYPGMFDGKFGLRLNGGFAWYGGESRVLSNAVSANITMGPVIRIGEFK